MTVRTYAEFEVITPGPVGEPPRAQGLSLREISSGSDDPLSTIMPFEQTEGGLWLASRWVGRFQHGDVSYTINPRIGMKLFNRIAVEAVSVALMPEGSGPGGNKLDSLQDLLPLVWCLAVRRARARQGIPRLYVERRSADRASLRGRLDLQRQLTENRFAQHHLACVWSELTFDNPITRMILTVVDHLARARSFPFGGQGAQFARELEELRAQLLLHRTYPSVAVPQRRIAWSRANDRFKIVHDLGYAILHNRGSGDDATTADGVLLDSAEIWELFLYRRLQALIQQNNLPYRVEWPRERRTAPRMLLEWEGRRTRALIPDIVVSETNGRRRTAILDAKYRAFAAPNIDHSVADQMALYAMNADAAEMTSPPAVLLIYPKAKRANGLNGSKGLNESIGDGLIGEGRFLFRAGREFRLIAWCVPLCDGNDDSVFDNSVKASLLALLIEAFPEVTAQQAA